MKLKDKVAIISGGTSGIGEACVKTFCAEGAKVVVAGRNVERGEKVARAAAVDGADVFFIEADVTSEKAIEAMVARTLERFGALDCAVNCAGVARTPALITDLTEEEWRINFDIMLLGVALSMKHQIRAMLAGNGGSVVNIASTAGLDGVPTFGPYVAAKHGVIGITKCAALEFATSNVRVNAICPGKIYTPMAQYALAETTDVDQFVTNVPMKRWGRPAEIAEAVLWLASDGGSYVTGQAISVDGGMLIGANRQAN